ncbi:hypothetical protein EJB05_45285, partial [Eragrostis curvula]
MTSMAATRPLIIIRALLLMLLPAIIGLAAGAKHANSERDALRAFQAGVSDPYGALRSWNSTAHFCRWAGVTCTQGHVTSLNVSGFGVTGMISPAVGNLTYLEKLNLDYNRLSGSIPVTLGCLRRLSFLSFFFTGGLGMKIPDSLRNCTSLKYVYIVNNALVGPIPDWLGTLPNLTYLWLIGNSFSCEIPSSLSNLTKLQSLSLYWNHLEGIVPVGLSQLPSLVEFEVGMNLLYGEIPMGFFDMPFLEDLSLMYNAFHGRLPPDAGTHVPQLRILRLDSNNLSGLIPASLASATSLSSLSLWNNSFTGQMPPEMGTLCPYELDLSDNKLTATDDDGGWEFLHRLTNCSKPIKGTLKRRTHPKLDLSGNRLRGTMPIIIGNLPRQLASLDLSNNLISGTVPPSIGNLVMLEQLFLDSNLLTGGIPEEVGNLKNLTYLNLNGNKITGPIPSSIGNLTELQHLVLNNNTLSGPIPSYIGNLAKPAAACSQQQRVEWTDSSYSSQPPAAEPARPLRQHAHGAHSVRNLRPAILVIGNGLVPHNKLDGAHRARPVP